MMLLSKWDRQVLREFPKSGVAARINLTIACWKFAREMDKRLAKIGIKLVWGKWI